jgi:hypothetical protein
MRAPISTVIRKVTPKTLGAMSVTVPLTLSVLVTSANADSLQIVGYSGHLGEWELTATVTGIVSQPNEYAGPLAMKHVGLCTQEGPEEKTGEIHLRVSGQQLDAVLSVAGVSCSYGGRLSDAYNGTLSCANREAVPLKLWVK